MSRVKWTDKRKAWVQQKQEQGANLLELDEVKSGKVSVNAIINAGHRHFGFGSHTDKVTGALRLTDSVSCRKIGTTRNRNRKSNVTVEEPTPASEALNKCSSELSLSKLEVQNKQDMLSDIIASLRTVGNDKLADDLEYCTS